MFKTQTKYVLIFALVFFGFSVEAQNLITGNLVDDDTKEPLVGATILAVGTSNGTVTDLDGNFSLEVPDGVTEVEISYLGYQSRIVNIVDNPKLDLSLVAGKLLDEVIVVGYGTIKREDATGSVQSVSSESFNRGALTGPQELLAGKVAGVSITGSGDPGGGSKIRIRGESSINASNDPLIVIDGVPLANDDIAGNRNPLDVINPNDIETFTVLKDASAAAIYGNRAAGGVIIITTKKGSANDKLSVGYSGNVSFGQVANKVDVLDATEYREAIKEYFGEDHPAYQNLGDADTDWQDEIYQTAFGHEHNLNISGGISALPYRLSLGHLNKDGILKTDNYKRNTLGLNVNPRFLDNALQVNLSLKGIWSKNRFGNRGAIGNANSFDPTQTPLDPNSAFAFDALNGGGKDESYSESRSNDLLEFYLNYKRDFAKNTIDLMGGYSWQKFDFENTFFRSDVAGNESETVRGEDRYQLYLLSLFGRINYSYNDRFLLTLSLRNDGTSRFAPENRWGLFPAAAVAIKLLENEEDRFNYLKLRLGYGVTGQENLGEKDPLSGQRNISNFYAYLPQYTEGFENATYQFGDSLIVTQRPEGYDANIKWEETTTYNLGLDFSIIKDRLSGSVDFYQRNTKDLLNRIPVPAGSNLTNFITTNIGNMENKGVELLLNLRPVDTKDFTWDFSVNGAYNRNEITKLTTSDDPTYVGILTGGIAGGVGSNIQIHSVGFAPSSFYVNEQVYNEDGSLLEGEFVDRDNDGVVNDLYRLEKPAADFTFGITSNLNYKNIGFSFGARSLIGNYVYNNVQTSIGYIERMVTSGNVLQNVHQSAVDLEVYNQGNLTFSDHFIEDAKFFRIDHVTLSYSLADMVGYGLGVYFTVQNPAVFTNYTGLDPETDNGIDNNLYPRPRTFVFGVSAKF